MKRNKVFGDLKYVIIEKVITYDNELPWYESIILDAYALIRKNSLSEEKAFGLDNSSVKIEYYPMIIHPKPTIALKRRL